LKGWGKESLRPAKKIENPFERKIPGEKSFRLEKNDASGEFPGDAGDGKSLTVGGPVSGGGMLIYFLGGSVGVGGEEGWGKLGQGGKMDNFMGKWPWGVWGSGCWV